MNIKHLMARVVLAATVCCGSANAALTCNISAVDNLSSTYDGLLVSDMLSSGTFTVTCTRTAAGDPTSVPFKVRTDDGLYNIGAGNRARLSGANYLNYDLFADPAYTLNWRNKNNNDINGTVTLGSGVPATQSVVMTFYSKIYAGQTGKPQGVYTDTVTLSLVYNGNTAPGVVMSVAISNIPTCSFSTPPGTVAFTYTAFSAAAAAASTTFAALCSTSLPYTMALDTNVGVVAGLAYTLALSSTTGTGTGAAQTYNINGTMPAGQAGTCGAGSCTDTKQHSVTISY